jgi:hypothetical protein
MKAKIMLGFLFVVLGTAFGVAALDDGPIPICRPGKPCQVEPKTFDGGPDPLCRPGIPCPKGIKRFDGDPIPVCRPNVPCPVQKQ